MSTALSILAAGGGVSVFIAGVWAIVRGIIRQTDATRENTEALRGLSDRMDTLTDQVGQHDRDIAFLKGMRRR